MEERTRTIDPKYILMARVIIPVVLALLSVFVVSKKVSSTDFHSRTIASLDEKRQTVMELTAASTAASAAITVIPGDTATPIAEKLADLSTYFLWVLCAIYLEKFLVTIMGYAAFTYIIPAGLLMLAVYALNKNESLKAVGSKLIVFALAIFMVIPLSIRVSNMIEETYSASIQETIDITMPDEERPAEPEKTGWNFLTGIKDTLTSSVKDATQYAQSMLNRFLEALAVMLVTSCVIPILVLIIFVWLTKIILGVNLYQPQRIALSE